MLNYQTHDMEYDDINIMLRGCTASFNMMIYINNFRVYLIGIEFYGCLDIVDA